MRRALLLVVLLALAPAARAAGILPGSSGKEPYTVDAGKLDYFEKEQKLIYSGEVIATQGATKMRGSVMTIYLDKPANPNAERQVRRIEMKGPVTLVQNGKIGTGDSAVYDKAENKWYLIGNVTLTEGTDVTQGEKLVYDLATSTALVDSGRQGRVKSVFTPKDSGADKPAPAAAPAPAADKAARPKPAPKKPEPVASRP